MPSKNIFLYLILFLSAQASLFCETEHNLLSKYLLPEDHSLQPILKEIFKNKQIFQSPDRWRSQGFDLLPRVHRGLMVASHPAAPNYLFKKFMDRVPQKTQLENYLRRVKGAQALGKFIEVNHLKHIVTPKKWLYPFPQRSKKDRNNYILIVERMDILPGNREPDGELAKKYAAIEPETLWELCFVLFHFRGLDSVLDNHPFTYSNQIAFIDTERWEGQRDIYLHHILPFLTRENRKLAQQFFNEFERGVIPYYRNQAVEADR